MIVLTFMVSWGFEAILPLEEGCLSMVLLSL